MRKLDVYQAAVRFLPLAAGIADSLPPRYAARSDPLRRASLSIPLNIAEGSGKSTGPGQYHGMCLRDGRHDLVAPRSKQPCWDCDLPQPWSQVDFSAILGYSFTKCWIGMEPESRDRSETR
ncbi:MAG: four helix bundle protein [Acidobacteriia bacterium]|nr:four helix bundle protein [Terriglobia bacterium]